MPKGDHVYVNRGLYSHHGIDMGDGRIIHYVKACDSYLTGIVSTTSFFEFAQGDYNSVQIGPRVEPFNPDLIISRAVERLGKKDYEILFNNCEHFTNYCKTGKEESSQIEIVGILGMPAVAGIGVAIAARNIAIAFPFLAIPIAFWSLKRFLDWLFTEPNYFAAIVTANGRFVYSDQNYYGNLTANGSEIKEWETFRFEHIGEGQIALRNFAGKFIYSDMNNGGVLVSGGDRINEWERFRIVECEQGLVSLQAKNGRYVFPDCSGDQRLRAQGNEINSWEKLRIILFKKKM